MAARQQRLRGGRVQSAARVHEVARAARVQRAPQLRVQVLAQRVHVVAQAAREYERLLRDHAYTGPEIIITHGLRYKFILIFFLLRSHILANQHTNIQAL